ncbi:MAG TPA: DNA repair protein RecN, partial [Ottowia sp.]|nr:DNA repair protein RecN [Ottowia sp.]
PEQLLALDQRLGQWLGLARRFRRPPQELHTVLAQWRAELAQLDAAADLAQLQARADAAQQTYRQSADAVSRQRRQTAPQLAAAVTEAMQLLGMAGGRFEVQLQALAEPAPHGLENVAFLVAAHAGSAPRAIERVASGGELSRLALAIAVTTSQLGTAGTLVFDEVDAGVGGAVAATVGRLLQRLGRDRQVLCVTHLPQVAACADAHLQVSKQTGDGLPTSQVAPLVGEARTREIARMLGGEQLSDTTLAHAREMLALPAQPPGAAARPRKVRA